VSHTIALSGYERRAAACVIKVQASNIDERWSDNAEDFQLTAGKTIASEPSSSSR